MTKQTNEAAGAPDFGPGFPSRGARIGPWWSAAWALMADGRARRVEDIVAAIPEPRIADTTAGNLLRGARSRGLLVADYVSVPSGRGPRARVTYRREVAQ